MTMEQPSPPPSAPAPVPVARNSNSNFGYHFGLALHSWKSTFSRMFRNNPGVGSPVANPTVVHQLKGTWLWLTAPLLATLCFLAFTWAANALVGNDDPWSDSPGIFDGTGPTLRLLLIATMVGLLIRMAAVAFIASRAGSGFRLNESANLAAIPLVPIPILAAFSIFFTLLEFPSFTRYVIFGVTAVISILGEISLYTAILGRGQFTRSITTLYATATGIAMMIGTWVGLELVKNILDTQIYF